MAQNGSDPSHSKIFKTLVSQDITYLWPWFCTCDYTFLKPTDQFNHFAFVSSGKHWFSDGSNYVINGDYDDRNDDNSDNYGVMLITIMKMMFMVIMIIVAATVMIMKTTMINITMVMIIVLMIMIRH